MVTEGIVRIIIQGSDRLTPVLDSVNGRLDTATESMMRKGKMFIGIGAMITGVLTGMTMKTAFYAGEVEKLSTWLGISAEESSKYVGISRVVGVSSGVVARALMILNKQLLSTKEGGKELREYLKGLGITLKATSSGAIDQAQLLVELAGAWEKIEDPSKRAEMLMKLFGYRGREVAQVLNLGKEGIKEAAERLKALGLVFTERELAKWEKFRQSWGWTRIAAVSFAKVIGEQFRPILEMSFKVILWGARIFNMIPEPIKKAGVMLVWLTGQLLIFRGVKMLTLGIIDRAREGWRLLYTTIGYTYLVIKEKLINVLKDIGPILESLKVKVMGVGKAFFTWLFWIATVIVGVHGVAGAVAWLIEQFIKLLKWLNTLPGVQKIISDRMIVAMERWAEKIQLHEIWAGKEGPLWEIIEWSKKGLGELGKVWEGMWSKAFADTEEKGKGFLEDMEEALRKLEDPIGRITKEIYGFLQESIPPLMESLKGVVGGVGVFTGVGKGKIMPWVIPEISTKGAVGGKIISINIENPAGQDITGLCRYGDRVFAFG